MTADVENLWTEFSGRLRQFIRSRISDEAAAEDILQDVFLKVQTKLGQFEDNARIQSWIFFVARNAVIDHYRTRKETVEVPETLVAEPSPDDPEIKGLKKAFRQMIESLPEAYREALVLTELEGLTQQQLADRAGISLSAAKSRVQRAREQLKQMLHECCTFKFDRRGRVIDCIPRPGGGCEQWS